MRLIRNIYAISLVVFLIATSCSGIKQDRCGVTVKIDQPQRGESSHVRIQVVGDKVFRVTAVPDGNFVDGKSLAVLPQECYSDFSVAETDDNVTVSTSSLSAKVDRHDGSVSFYGSDGRLLLAEQPSGRNFIPIERDGTTGYTVTQHFLSPSDDEALYGLGQHQSEEFNYKGKSEELYQYNTKVSVPFILSTSGYGLLWD
ncbi:MAG: alpha-xylosidase, partial [Candidatus Cryptobacteroides sp.]